MVVTTSRALRAQSENMVRQWTTFARHDLGVRRLKRYFAGAGLRLRQLRAMQRSMRQQDVEEGSHEDEVMPCAFGSVWVT